MHSLRRPLALALLLFASNGVAAAQPAGDAARWAQQAQAVTITRDDWGIAHVRGKTDADAVFGAIYAQAEDDFNRVETNYLNAMGRLAEVEGSRSEAIRAYQKSLELQPDRAVQKRLRLLMGDSAGPVRD